MNGTELLARLKEHPMAAGRKSLGIVGSYGKGVEIDDEGDKNDIIAIATTDDIDLDNEIIVPGGLNKTYIEKNRKVFVDHMYGIHEAAGFIRSISAYPSTSDQKGWRVRIGLMDNPSGRAVKQLAKETGQIGLSIGFYPTDYGPLTEEEREKYAKGGTAPTSIVRAGEWFELSFTALPCNVSCQGEIAVGQDSKMVEKLRTLVVAGDVDERTAEHFGAGRKTVKVLSTGAVIEIG
jgi:hypothetical protein